MDINNMMAIREEQKLEHDAWLEMFAEIAKAFGITKKELNKPKYRKAFEMIEKWAFYDRERRKAIIELEGEDKYPFGLFWKGD